MGVITSVRLECVTAHSNKFYKVSITKESDEYIVIANWGRIGTSGSFQNKGKFKHLSKAEIVANSLINSKKLKGYKEVVIFENKNFTDKTKENVNKTSKEISLNRFSDILE